MVRGWLWPLFAGVCALVLVRDAAAQPRLAIEGPIFEFGRVDQGMTVDHTFRLINQGTEVLHLDQVKTTCGCTVAVTSDADIAPGQAGTVHVTLDTYKLAGRTTKTVTVYSNDPLVPAAGLTLVGDVITDLTTLPSTLWLGRLRQGATSRFEIAVAPGRPEAPATATAVTHGSRFLSTRIEPAPDGGAGQRIVVETVADIPLGKFNDEITITTTSQRMPTIVVPVFGMVDGDIAVLPPEARFGVATAGAAQELFIRNLGRRPIAVTGVTIDADVATWELETARPGVEWKLTLRLRDGLPPGKVDARVEIHTDHPQQATVVVPLAATIAPATGKG